MPPTSTPIALAPLHCTDFIDFILRHHTPPTTLIICSTREIFLHQLQATINHTARPRNRPLDPTNIDHDEPSSDNDDNNDNDIESHPTLHPLMIPTIHLIAKSRSVTLAFAPTVPHLRAYVATIFHSPTDFEPAMTRAPAPTPVKPGTQYPMLAVWGLANLHRSTAEHSAQGLSRSLAVVVEAAKRNGQKLVLAESKALDVEGEVEGGGGEGDPWTEQVPLMNGSLRFRGDDRVWAGKTVEVKRVVGRWCRFVAVNDGG